MAIAGCSDQPPAYPVNGKVLVNGSPAEGAGVFLIPDNPLPAELRVPKSRARVDAEGNFAVSTYATGDGAPAGGYGVSIVWITQLNDAADPEEAQTVDRLEGRFADPKESGLRLEVAAGLNEIPAFELSLPASRVSKR